MGLASPGLGWGDSVRQPVNVAGQAMAMDRSLPQNAVSAVRKGVQELVRRFALPQRKAWIQGFAKGQESWLYSLIHLGRGGILEKCGEKRITALRVCLRRQGRSQ